MRIKFRNTTSLQHQRFLNWISSKMNQVNCCGRWKLFIFCGRLVTRTFLNLSGSLDIHTKILTEGNTTYATDRVEAINLSKIEIWFENSWCASAALFEFVFYLIASQQQYQNKQIPLFCLNFEPFALLQGYIFSVFCCCNSVTLRLFCQQRSSRLLFCDSISTQSLFIGFYSFV